MPFMNASGTDFHPYLCCLAAAYESQEYYRKTVQPVLEDGTTVTADVYIWRDDYK